MPKSSPLFVGIDLGTSGCRAIAIDQQGGISAEVSTDLPGPTRDGTKVEQDPQLWWQAVCHVIQQLSQAINPADIYSISVDGTSSTLILVDQQGNPVAPVLMYNDARASDQLPLIKQHAPKNSPVHSASSTLAKVLWCEKQGLLEKAHHIMHQSDWILGQLTGEYGLSDINNCIKLGYDAEHSCWPTWLASFPINMSMLPEVVTPGQVIGNIQPAVANKLGLPGSIRICAGTTDSTAAVIATGIHQKGEAVTSLGSTLVIKVLAERPISSTEYGVYSQPLFGNWLVGGASNSGGNVLRHYFNQDELDRLTPQLTPDQPTGLKYYPLTSTGERFPVNDNKLEPQLQPRPESDVEFFQAILEGISEIERQGYQLLADLGAPYPDKIVTVGGGATNKHWQTIRERSLNTNVTQATHLQAAYGTALLARLQFIEPTFNNK